MDQRGLVVPGQVPHLPQSRPTSEQETGSSDVSFGPEPRDCLVVRAERAEGPDDGRARGLTSKKEVTKDSQGMNARQQLEDVMAGGWTPVKRLLHRLLFASFIGNRDRVVILLAIGLREDH